MRAGAYSERNREFARRYLGGETLQAIGDDYGVTRERVRQILRAMGVDSLGRRPEHCKQPHDLTADEIAAAKAYAGGERPSSVTARHGITHGQLISAVKRLGFEVKESGYWLRRDDDAELTERVCALYSDGKGPREIARLVPALSHPEAVYHYLARGGIKPRRRSNKGILERQAKAVLALRSMGFSYVEIAESFGASPGGVAQFFKRRGMTRKRRGSPDSVRHAACSGRRHSVGPAEAPFIGRPARFLQSPPGRV